MPTAAAPNGSNLILSARHKIFGQRTVWALNVSGLIYVSVQRHQEADPAPALLVLSSYLIIAISVLHIRRW